MSNPNRHGIRENFVYWIFDEDDVCLYIGMTRQPERRWAQHRSAKPDMFQRAAYKRMAGPFDLETARRLERDEQDAWEPVYDERIHRKWVREQSLAAFREGLAQRAGAKS